MSLRHKSVAASFVNVVGKLLGICRASTEGFNVELAPDQNHWMSARQASTD
jgi:hypothetical protein